MRRSANHPPSKLLFVQNRTMPPKKRSRHKRREIIREQAMGPVIPNRKDYKELYAHEKSGVLKIGVVTHKIFDLQVAGEYRFEVRCNIRSPEHVAWTPQYVCEGGPKKYIHLYRGYGTRRTHRMCGVFPLRGSTVMDSEPFDKLPHPDVVPKEVARLARDAAYKAKKNPPKEPPKLACWTTTGNRATKYTVYRIDKPVWLGTDTEWDALVEARQFPWAQ